MAPTASAVAVSTKANSPSCAISTPPRKARGQVSPMARSTAMLSADLNRVTTTSSSKTVPRLRQMKPRSTSSPMERKNTMTRMLSIGRTALSICLRWALLPMTSPARKAP